jgi:glycosyltransferase involved in cell wall biosynthesis
MDLSTEVIVCTYNGSAFITEQLKSLLKQTRCVDKISIYDDQSTDDTVRRIQDFISRQTFDDRRLFSLQVNPVNVGYARNYCNAIAKATKDLLFLCDQDDVWESQKVERLLDVFNQYNADMAFSDGTLIDQSGQALRGKLRGKTVLQSYGITDLSLTGFKSNAFQFLIRRNYINGAAMAIRRSAAQAAMPLPCDMPHDYWLAIWCSLHDGIVGTPQTLYRYRQHANNAVGIGPSSFLYELLGVWKHSNMPRHRELRIWKSVIDRIAGLPRKSEVAAAQRKLEWLSLIVTDDKRSLTRAFEVVKSVFNGNYGTYSTMNACLRDIMSFFR